jgi:anaphase-promoting complex subunit 11
MTSPFEVKSVSFFTSSVHNLPQAQEICTICHSNLNAPSLYRQDKIIDYVIITGKCGHTFHSECINTWIDKNKNKKCPTCSQTWEYSPTV